VRAALHDPAPVQDRDAVGGHDGTEPVVESVNACDPRRQMN